MEARSSLSHFLHRHLLPLILLSYVLAATCPTMGMRIRDARLASFEIGPRRIEVSPQMLMLSYLLFAAGLAVKGDRVRQIATRPTIVFAGLAANLTVPLAYLLLVIIPAVAAWHNSEEGGTIIAGLALVSAMPVAGSSTGWARSAGGDMALSLGLVLASTLLSPLTTPFCLRLIVAASPSGHAADLGRLARHDAGTFLTLWVLLPSMLGLLARRILGGARAEAIERVLKPLGPLVLLVLCYSGAAACLPRVLHAPDWDFLGLTFAFVIGLCTLTFGCGLLIGRILKADRDQRAALTFALGMNNNGTGLVLASLALASRPTAVLPLIVYNLAQHVAAGIAGAWLRRSGPQG
jgi:BASS family bile acid:Na+ symporter